MTIDLFLFKKSIYCQRFHKNIFSYLPFNLKKIRKLDKYELKLFIDICDNRINRSDILLSEVASLLGFDLVALSIITTLAKNNEIHFYTPLSFLMWGIIVILIIFGLTVGSLVVRYRSQVHAWAAFKEKAILMKKKA